MAWYKKELLLVPQYPDKYKNSVYAIARSSISAAVKSGTPVPTYRTLRMEGLDEIRQQIGETYDGFEATVLLGDRIYFTIEADEKNPNCYLVSGTISRDRIVLQPALTILPKTKRLSNAGFESLAYWPARQQLMAFFEYNKADAPPSALPIQLTPSPQVLPPIPIAPLPFRLTDIVYSGKKGRTTSFIGINFLYNGAKEFREYVGKDSLVDEPSLAGKILRKTTYTRLMRLSVDNDHGTHWTKLRDITFASDNYEGIALFKDGVLLITDEYPASVLIFLKMPGK